MRVFRYLWALINVYFVGIILKVINIPAKSGSFKFSIKVVENCYRTINLNCDPLSVH